MARRIDIDYSPNVKPVTVNLEASVGKGGKIAELFGELVAHHKRKGRDDVDAKELAYLELTQLYGTAHGKFREHFVGSKGTIMDRLLAVEDQTLRFYADIVHGNTRPDIPKLRTLLSRMGDLFDELRRPARKVLDDVEAQRAARAQATFEAIPPTRPLDTPAQQRPIMTPHEKFDLLKEKGWTVAADGKTATKTKDGVQYKATIDESHPQQLVTMEVTKPGKQTQVYVEGEVRSHGSRPDPSGNVIQSHHGVQDAACIALSDKHGDLGYRSDDAPALAMRNHKGGSPHNRISGVQNSRKPESFTNFGDIRQKGIEDLKHAPRPREEIVAFVKAWDAYFEATIWPKIKARYPNDPAKQQSVKGTFSEVY